LNKVEPRISVTARNLFAKDRSGAALPNEPVERWPKVPLVCKPISFACRAERLAWAGAGPHFIVVGDSGVPERTAPDSNSSEEVALGISSKVNWSNVLDASLIDFSFGYLPVFDELAQLFGRERIDLVVVRPFQLALLPASLPTTGCSSW